MAKTLDKKPGIMIYDPDVINDMLQDMDKESVGEAFIAFFKYAVDNVNPFNSVQSAPVRMLLRPLCKSKEKSDEAYLKKIVDGRYSRYKQLCKSKEESYLPQEEWSREIDVFDNPSDYIYSTDPQVIQILSRNKEGYPREPQGIQGNPNDNIGTLANLTKPNVIKPKENEIILAKPSVNELIEDKHIEAKSKNSSEGHLADNPSTDDSDIGEGMANANKEIPFARDSDLDDFLLEQGIAEDQITEFRENKLKPYLSNSSKYMPMSRDTWRSSAKAHFFNKPKNGSGSTSISEAIADVPFRIPTPGEVTYYCRSKGYQFDPIRFFEYHQNRNWELSGSKIRDWKKVADSWEKREQEQGFGKKGELPYL